MRLVSALYVHVSCILPCYVRIFDVRQRNRDKPPVNGEQDDIYLLLAMFVVHYKTGAE